MLHNAREGTVLFDTCLKICLDSVPHSSPELEIVLWLGLDSQLVFKTLTSDDYNENEQFSTAAENKAESFSSSALRSYVTAATLADADVSLCRLPLSRVHLTPAGLLHGGRGGSQTRL